MLGCKDITNILKIYISKMIHLYIDLTNNYGQIDFILPNFCITNFLKSVLF